MTRNLFSRLLRLAPLLLCVLGVFAPFHANAKGDLLRRPDDARDQVSYKGPMLGKTDRFVVVFRKSAP